MSGFLGADRAVELAGRASARASALAATPGARRWWRALLGNPAAAAGTTLLVAFGVVALAAPWIAPCPAGQERHCGDDPYRVPRYGFAGMPRPPSAEHPFGTTGKQYDVFYGLVWGTRTAFRVGLLITIPALLVGVAVGATAGYFGGWADEILMRTVEVFMAFPFFVAAVTLASALRAHPQLGQGLLAPMLALLAFGWMGYARLLRASVLSVKERDYVWAARALGVGDGRIILRHVIPNSMFSVLVAASLDVGGTVLAFAGLSFFGLGVPDGYADWGQMLAAAHDRLPSLGRDWHLVVFPALALVLFALGCTLVGDGIRDALDPQSASRLPASERR